MNTKAQQLLVVVILSIAYLSLGLFGDTGKIISGLIGTFAVGWLVMDLAKAIIK